MTEPSKPELEALEKEEVTIEVNLPLVGRTYLPVIITGQKLFVSVTSLFEVTHIYYRQDAVSIQGYFNNDNLFNFDLKRHKATCGSAAIDLSPDNSYIFAQRLYVESRSLDSLLGIHLEFYFASLSADIRSKIELPIVAKARRALQYQKLSSAKSPSVTIISDPEPSILGLNAIDWSLTSSISSYAQNASTYRAVVGGNLIGGSFWLAPSGSFNSTNPWRTLFWDWKYSADDGIVRQVNIGNRINLRLPTFGREFRGVQVTNEPIKQNEDFGILDFRYPLSIGSTIELYKNDELISYQFGDSTGQSHIAVPLSYGATRITVKQYGPYGEEMSTKQLIQVPKSLVPSGQLRYTASSGVLGNDYTHILSQAELSAGLSNNFTLSGGIQYYSEVGYEPLTFFTRIQSNILKNCFFLVDYIFQQKFHASFDYLSTSGIQLQTDYQLISPTKQLSLLVEPLEKINIQLTLPIKLWSKPLNVRARIFEYAYEFEQRTITANIASSIFFGEIPFTASIDGQVHTGVGNALGNIRTSVQTYIPVFRNTRLHAGATYDHTMNVIANTAFSLTSRIDNIDFSIKVEKPYHSALSVQAGLGVKLPFVSIMENGGVVADQYSLSNTAQGSVKFGRTPQDISFHADPAVSTASVLIRPYLDLNRNNVRDPNEPPVLNVDIEGYKRNKQVNSDGSILINYLSPHEIHYLRCQTDRLEEPTWKPFRELFAVTLKPDQTQVIDFPLYPVSEIAGTVKMAVNGTKRLLQDLTIIILDSLGKEYDVVPINEDGTFYYSGLPAGTYSLDCKADENSSHRFRLIKPVHFTINHSTVGEFFPDMSLIFETY